MILDYGIFGCKLEEQVNEEGFTLGEDAEHLEDIRHSINIVDIFVATEAQTHSMLKKLNKMVTEALKPIAKEQQKLDDFDMKVNDFQRIMEEML